MYRIRDRALHALGQNLLDLLRDNRVLAVVQRVGLGCRLARSSASGVNLTFINILIRWTHTAIEVDVYVSGNSVGIVSPYLATPPPIP